MKKSQSGFTLVEIAIVLVIVGLLLGAVLKGQELIFNTRVEWHLQHEPRTDRRGQRLPGPLSRAAGRRRSGRHPLSLGRGGTDQRQQQRPDQLGDQPLRGGRAGRRELPGVLPPAAGRLHQRQRLRVAEVRVFVERARGCEHIHHRRVEQPGHGAGPQRHHAQDHERDRHRAASTTQVRRLALGRCQNVASYNMAAPDTGIGAWCALAM